VFQGEHNQEINMMGIIGVPNRRRLVNPSGKDRTIFFGKYDTGGLQGTVINHMYRRKNIKHLKICVTLRYHPKNHMKNFVLLCILNRQFSPKVSIFRQREEFYNLRQNANEDEDWFARIKNVATTFTFGKGLIDVLRDKFITGMRNGPIKDRLSE